MVFLNLAQKGGVVVVKMFLGIDFNHQELLQVHFDRVLIELRKFVIFEQLVWDLLLLLNWGRKVFVLLHFRHSGSILRLELQTER